MLVQGVNYIVIILGRSYKVKMIDISRMSINHIVKCFKSLRKKTNFMVEIPNEDPKYGTLSADYPFYVKRAADQELLNNLKNGSLCYVFNARRTGKSSLIAKVRHQLENKAGFISMTISINQITVRCSPEKFYVRVIEQMLDQQKQEFYEAILTYKFNPKDLANSPEYLRDSQNMSSIGKTGDYREFLQNFAKRNFREEWFSEQLNNYTPQEIFRKFIELIMYRVQSNILIIFDEIDTFLSISNNPNTFLEKDKNEFFTFIREYHNQSNRNPPYLVFCLIGCVTPNALINDKNVTPLNNAIPIDLKYFDFQESDVLVKKLEMRQIQNPQETLKKIFHLTSGQPMLTQRLCDIIDQNLTNLEPINCLKDNKLLEHFSNIEDFINAQKITGSILNLYAKILERFEKQEEPLDFNSSEEQLLLCLSGLVINNKGKIEISNKIIFKRFNKKWVTDKIHSLRTYEIEKALKWQETQNPSLLLTGEELEKAVVWKDQIMGGQVKLTDSKFIQASTINQALAPKQLELALQKVILNMSQRLVGKITDWENLRSEILNWTNSDFDLSSLICNSIDFTLPIENIETEVKKWIEQNIITNWENNIPLAEKINTIRSCLLDSEYSFRRLETYEKFLEGESTDIIDTELVKSGLITGENNEFRVSNKIYESIFNLEWVKKYLPPYANSLASWQSSVFQDKSYLLNDEDLQKALNWIENKDKLSELELSFIVNSVIWGYWQSDEVVNQIKEFLPHLKEKTYTHAHLIRIIQVIIIGTRPQLVFLKQVLELVKKSQDIPDVNEKKWLEILLQSHLESSTAQNIFKYLDFNNPYNKTWENLKNENAFEKVDNFTNVSQISDMKKILDLYQISRQNDYNESLTNFQPLISNVLYRKFKQAYNMAGQKEFDQLLDKIVEDAGGDIEAIIIFDLTEGLPLYHNKGLKDRNLRLYTALFGEGDDGDGGEAIEGFATLNKMQDAFNNFGQQTEFGNQKSMLVNFASGKMMIYFHQAPDIPTAICFMASKEINLGSINRKVNQVIQEIKNKLGDL